MHLYFTFSLLSVVLHYIQVWSLTQAPLIVDTDVRNMTKLMKAALLNKELIDIHQSTATPPGKFLGYWACDEPLACGYWGRKITPTGNSW